MRDITEGGSISVPSPAEIETITIMYWARRHMAEDRDPTDERFHAAVTSWIDK